MIKKVILGIAVFTATVAMIPMFAAFEAHVLNVTATIENALNVPLSEIKFGTVFPQEQLDKPLSISLSNSFRNEGRVDDVSYTIRQKPKCGLPIPGTDPVQYGDFKPVSDNEEDFECPQGYIELPLLCPYLSKHSEVIGQTENGPRYEDGSLNSFHGPIEGWDLSDTIKNQVNGHLAKSNRDFEDIWDIDLKTPCFNGHCGQDWAEFVHSINSSARPEQYIQNPSKEHQLFGCDLWVEVTGISLPGLGCQKKLDLMLVLDRSGSISSSELNTLKTAAKKFVDALAPSADGAHIGQTSFSTNGTLDLHLSSNSGAIKAAIDTLVSGGFTNLMEGIDLAQGELNNPGDGHDRNDSDSKDFMVIITDGAPNRPVNTATGKAKATESANAAKAAGTVIYVVGVGTTPGTADYLKNNIASSPNHYFDAADFNGLEAILKKILECNSV